MSSRANQNPISLVEKQVQERRRRILAAARRFVVKHGVDDVNVRDLADACRISVPTIYRTFGSKEGLLREAMQPYVEAKVQSDLSEVHGEGYVRLLGSFELWSRGFSGEHDEESAFMSELLGSKTGQALAWKVSDQIRAEAERTLRDMQARGELEPWADPRALATRIAGQTVITAIECASGTLSPLGYRSAFMYSACLIVLAVAVGSARDALRERAQRAQAGSLEALPTRVHRAPR